MTVKYNNEEMCCSFPMDFTHNLKVKGIPAARYTLSNSVIDQKLFKNLWYCPYIEEFASADRENESWDLTKCEQKCPKVL